jgi:hypothetical protein
VVFILTKATTRRVTQKILETHREPLEDILHSSLPEWVAEYQEYTDWFPTMAIIMFIICDKFSHALDFIWLMGILYLLRLISFSITIVPSPDMHCNTEPDTALRGVFHQFWQEGCGDLIFSGHTMSMVLASLFIWKYCFPGNYMVAGALVMYNVMGMLLIIGTRMHYTVDVFIATIITVLLTRNYFQE